MTLKSKINVWMCAALTTLALASPAGALIVHDSLAHFPASRTAGYAVGPLDPGQAPYVNQPAQSFNIEDDTVTLDTLTVRLLASREHILDAGQNTLVPTGNAGDDFVVRLWDNEVLWDNNDRPGNLLESFTVPNSGSLSTSNQNPSNVTLNSLLHPQLNLGEIYWVSVAIPEVNSTYSHGSWQFSSAIGTGRAIAFSNSAATNWSVQSTPNNMSAFQVTGSPIPEPATAGLILSMLAFASIRRTRA